MKHFHLEPLHDDFGARVTGIDIAQELPAAALADLRRTIDDYSLVHFPGQDMDDEAQLRFTRSLGQPEPNHVTYGNTGRIEYFGTIGNVIDAARQHGNDAQHTVYQSGNNLWHSDSSFRQVPSFVSINHAYEVPGHGGDTEFASMRAAYGRLPKELRARIDPLIVVHDYVFSRSRVAPVNPNHAASLLPVEHPLVRTNPGNGKKNFYLGSHARGIVGMEGVEARALIDELNDRATRPEHLYSHHWAVGDTLLWDNRCTLHRGTGFDADRWRRLLRQTRVQGESPVT